MDKQQLVFPRPKNNLLKPAVTVCTGLLQSGTGYQTVLKNQQVLTPDTPKQMHLHLKQTT